ncbi:hypothetical protein CCHL11_10040, partial [Colletotrichum chlorophyti]
NSTVANLHTVAVCINTERHGSTGNGTPYCLTCGSFTEYDIDVEATKCACAAYKRRNVGTCPSDQCLIDGLQCHSNRKHIGGSEMGDYCRRTYGAHGSKAN